MIRIAAGAMLAMGCSIGSPFAADIITVPTSASTAFPVSAQPGFDWNGFYAGVYGSVRDQAGDTEYGLGLQAGVNAEFDFFLLGAEVAVQGLTGGGDAGSGGYGQLLGRAGLVVADDVLVFAAGGYGIDLGEPEEDEVLVGGGVEWAVSDSVTIDGQYLHGFAIDDAGGSDQITVGANFHF